MGTVLVCTANPLLDHLTEAALQHHRMNRCDAFDQVAGGKGINVGRVLARHGHRVIATGFAGGWSGERLRALVTADGQEPAFTETDARLRIGFTLTHEGDTTGMMEHGFAVSAEEQQSLLARVAEQLPIIDLVIVSGSVPDPNCGQLYAAILDHCATAEVPCWVDSYGPAMDAALTNNHPPSLVKPNRQEYEQGSGWERAGACHRSDGPHAIAVRDGERQLTVRPPETSAVNPLGSGDSYVAGLAHGFLEGWGLERRLRWAAAAGTANATRSSVADIGPDDVAEWVESVCLEYC